MLPDVKLDHAIENLVDGAFFNSGQMLLRHRAHLCAREGLRAVRRRFRRAHEEIRRRQSARPGDDARADGARELCRSCAQPQRGGAAQGREAAHRDEGRERQARLALPRAGGADQRQPPDGGDARGDLRAGRRHHEGARRRRGDHADERQPLRADRLDLDDRHGPRGGDRRSRRDRHGLHEPLRLCRSRRSSGPA